MADNSSMNRVASTIDLQSRDEAELGRYRRLVEEAEAPQAAVLARAGDLEIRFGDPAAGAQHLARAAGIYAEAGLLNLALALSHRLLHLDPPPVDEYLRLGELSAAKGYARDARLGYMEYAEHRVRDGDTVAARGALEAYLRAFPDDATVRRRLAEISGADAADLTPPPPASIESADLGVLPTLVDSHLPAEPEAAASAGAVEELLTHTAPPVDPGSFEIAPLEGLESNQADGGWEQPASEPEPAADALPLLGFGPEFDSPADVVAEELAATEAEEEPLPLLGFDSLPELQPGPDAEAELEPEVESVLDSEPVVESEPEPEPGFEPEPEPEVTPPLPPFARPAHDYVDLGALILSEEADLPAPEPRAEAEQPAGDEAHDLEEILALLGDGVPENVDPREAASHYDLGLAFKEMGLLGDAIAQLQRALRGGAHPLATLEVLGECFIDRGDPGLAARVLQRAAQLRNAREQDLVGVLYWLGRAREELGDLADARAAYERVAAADIGFRDVVERLREF
jgi:tetratricopeptide (TPR) repeat protein